MSSLLTDTSLVIYVFSPYTHRREALSKSIFSSDIQDRSLTIICFLLTSTGEKPYLCVLSLYTHEGSLIKIDFLVRRRHTYRRDTYDTSSMCFPISSIHVIDPKPYLYDKVSVAVLRVL